MMVKDGQQHDETLVVGGNTSPGKAPTSPASHPTSDATSDTHVAPWVQRIAQLERELQESKTREVGGAAYCVHKGECSVVCACICMQFA